MRLRRMMRSIAGALALCLLAPVGGAVAHDGKANPVVPGASAKSVALKLGDDALVDQDRRTLKFKNHGFEGE